MCVLGRYAWFCYQQVPTHVLGEHAYQSHMCALLVPNDLRKIIQSSLGVGDVPIQFQSGAHLDG